VLLVWGDCCLLGCECSWVLGGRCVLLLIFEDFLCNYNKFENEHDKEKKKKIKKKERKKERKKRKKRKKRNKK
jgi:hypothetical protein